MASSSNHLQNILSLHPPPTRGQWRKEAFVVQPDRTLPDNQAGFRVYDSDRFFGKLSYLTNGEVRLDPYFPPTREQFSWFVDREGVNVGWTPTVTLPSSRKTYTTEDGVPTTTPQPDGGIGNNAKSLDQFGQRWQAQMYNPNTHVVNRFGHVLPRKRPAEAMDPEKNYDEDVGEDGGDGGGGAGAPDPGVGVDEGKFGGEMDGGLDPDPDEEKKVDESSDKPDKTDEEAAKGSSGIKPNPVKETLVNPIDREEQKEIEADSMTKLETALTRLGKAFYQFYSDTFEKRSSGSYGLKMQDTTYFKLDGTKIWIPEPMALGASLLKKDTTSDFRAAVTTTALANMIMNKPLTVPEDAEIVNKMAAAENVNELISLGGDNPLGTIQMYNEFALPPELKNSLKERYAQIKDTDNLPEGLKKFTKMMRTSFASYERDYVDAAIVLASAGNTDEELQKLIYPVGIRSLISKNVELSEFEKDFAAYYMFIYSFVNNHIQPS